MDAELDWREWTDQQENKREAVTLKARQVLFEGGRSTHTAAGEGSEQNGAPPPAAGPSDAAPVGVSAAGSEGTASADDLPF